MNAPIRVGIVGVSAGRGWAAEAHVPALRALPAYEITALSTTRQETADAAAQHFGVKLAFADHDALVRHPEVDLVVITVKVAHHREIIEAALAAGKDVYSEWPLGRDLADVEAITAASAKSEARTMAGLQSRFTPAVLHARDLVAGGYVGQVLSTTMVGSGRTGGVIDLGNAYSADRANGAGLLRQVVAHSADLLAEVLGDFVELSAVLDTRRPNLVLLETSEPLLANTPDQVAVIGRLATGVTASLHFREGHHGGEGFLWEINGTEGTLQLRAPVGHPGMFPVSVSGARGDGSLADIVVPSSYYDGVPGIEHLRDTTADSVARMYDAFAADLRDGSHRVPDFTEALHTHRVLHAIEEADAAGTRVTLQARGA